MSLAFTALMLAGAAVAGQVADTKIAKPVCADEQPKMIRGKPDGRAHPLSQEPDADRILTVLRTENGCNKPVRIKRDRGRG